MLAPSTGLHSMTFPLKVLSQLEFEWQSIFFFDALGNSPNIPELRFSLLPLTYFLDDTVFCTSTALQISPKNICLSAPTLRYLGKLL